MTRAYRPYTLDQQLLLPPDMRQWLPEGDLALFISDVVDELDLAAIYRSYETGDGRGQPPYEPAMMVKVLLYAYCTGLRSSRKIEQATYRDVAIRVLAGDQHPDHDSIAEFRTRHLPALAGLFVQGLRLCQAAGLVKLGHVALDGTKVQANASKHKAMSYARMSDTEHQLEREVRALLDQAEQADAAVDAQYGPGQRGDDLPAELARRASRLAKIRAAKAVLEQQARDDAARAADAGRAKLAARAQRVGSAKGGVPKVPDPAQAQPEPGAQYNFTDPASRIMLDGASKSWVQAYNAQAAVDDQAQIVAACAVTQEAIDVQQFVPLLSQVQTNTGQQPFGRDGRRRLFQRGESDCDGARGPGLLRPAGPTHAWPRPGADNAGAERDRGPDAREAACAGGPAGLRAPQGDRRAGLWSSEGGPRLSALLPPRL